MTARRLRAATLLLALAAAGCATIHRPKTTKEALRAEIPAARARDQEMRDTIVARLARRVERAGNSTLDILVLSGGGTLGAYGAGFLRGWRSNAQAPMPAFDLVTGISTGGLQAPFALLGTPEALDTLATLYREAPERTPVRIHWNPFRRTGGILEKQPLERTIAGFLDERMATELRAQFAADRQLLVGTTDFDLGTPRTWDMAQALADTNGLARARRLLRTTSAIPGVFPPEVIDGHVHADGGVIANALSPLGVEDYRHLAARLARPVTVRVWLVMNLFVDPPVEVLKPASASRMGKRLGFLLFYGAQPQVVERFATLARAVSGVVPGVTMELRVTALDAALASDPAAEKFIDAEFMRRIADLGYQRARGERAWDVVVTGR